MEGKKNSNIPWVGEIPKHWKLIHNKYLFDCSKEIVGSLSNSTQLLSLTTKGVVKKGQDITGGKIPESYDTYQIVEENNLVLCLFDLDCSAVFSGISKFRGMISPAYKVVSCRDSILPRYADYWFKYIFDGRKYKHYSKNLRFTLSYDEFGTLTSILPPIAEQQYIADFLDRKCADIDNVLEKTKASIEEYKKLKQSVITEAVTKGIRGERPMKDSGIEWIGKIPKEWSKYRKLSSICSKGISYGIVKLFDPDENGVKVLRCSDVQPGYILTDNIRTVTKELSNEYKRTILNGGEIVINVRGTLGGCAIVPDSMKGYNIAREVALVDTFGINKKYLMYFFLSDLFKLYQQMNLAGSVYVGLNIELLSSCPILKPSLDEQQEIASYLDKKCSEIDTLIASKEKFIAGLESYKKSLIYEYVTGKKEVPTEA